MNTTVKRLVAAGVLVVLVGVSAACSGGGGVDAMSASDGEVSLEGGGVAEAPKDVQDHAWSDTDSSGAPGVNRTTVQVRSVIKTGMVALTSRDPDAVRARIDGLLVALGGSVDSEQTTHDDDGDIRRSTLVLRVPVEEFGNAMGQLEKLGTTKDSDTNVKDVTTEVIDIDERVETLQRSLNRLQGYLSKASTLDDLLRFEQQITQREGELQSLKAQQSYLADQTAMSTITVHLAKKTRPAPPPGALDDAGFLAGLASGWNALKSAVVVTLTVVGAVLPFAVVLALVAVPVWLLVRRTVRARGAGTTAPATTPGPPPAD